MWTLEASLNVYHRISTPELMGHDCSLTVIYFRRPLTKIGPGVWVVEKSMFIRSLGRPDHARGGTRGIEAGMWLMSLV